MTRAGQGVHNCAFNPGLARQAWTAKLGQDEKGQPRLCMGGLSAS